MPKKEPLPKLSEQEIAPESASQQEQRERQAEQPSARPETSGQEKPDDVMMPPQSGTGSISVPPAETQKSETLEQIERIMETDLQEVYQTMPPEKKMEFKKKGEETAAELETMMYKVKVNSKKIFKLLFSWLKIIPGVNRYFLQQEAKLKTDELLDLKEEMNRGGKQEL